jgi:uncharacterized protein YifN (PemK superfamily)
MVKRRPCVVIAPRLRNRSGLCAVVPLSTSAPDPVEPYHHELALGAMLPKPWATPRAWAKCDMLAAVSFQRLTPVGVGRRADGRRLYLYPHVEPQDLKRIRAAVLHGLALGALTDRL